MKILKILLLTMLVFSPIHAEIFTWTDSNGTVHFSDNPHPGAEKINTPIVQTDPGSQGQQPDNSPSVKPKPAEEEARGYDTLAIAEPTNEETLRSNEGYVAVIVDIIPDLKSGDTLQVILDGKALGKPQANKLFALNKVNRGTHKIAVQVMDAEGNVLQTSDEVIFFMHHAIQGKTS